MVKLAVSPKLLRLNVQKVPHGHPLPKCEIDSGAFSHPRQAFQRNTSPTCPLHHHVLPHQEVDLFW